MVLEDMGGPSGAQGLLLALLLGIIPRELRGPYRMLGLNLDSLYEKQIPYVLCNCFDPKKLVYKNL